VGVGEYNDVNTRDGLCQKNRTENVHFWTFLTACLALFAYQLLLLHSGNRIPTATHELGTEDKRHRNLADG
jgi:hypothetical protein